MLNLGGFRRRPELATKLSKAERLVQEQMLALIEWASDRPARWHDLGRDPATMKAAEHLEKRGVIEVRQPQNQYRITPRIP